MKSWNKSWHLPTIKQPKNVMRNWFVFKFWLFRFSPIMIIKYLYFVLEKTADFLNLYFKQYPHDLFYHAIKFSHLYLNQWVHHHFFFNILIIYLLPFCINDSVEFPFSIASDLINSISQKLLFLCFVFSNLKCKPSKMMH